MTASPVTPPTVETPAGDGGGPSPAPPELWQEVAARIRDLCESSGWEINQTQAELATAAVWDLLLCTPDERELLDHIADNPRPDVDLDAVLTKVDAENAVIAAAVALDRADREVKRLLRIAAESHRGTTAIAAYDDALRRVGDARRALTAAVRELEGK